MSREQVLPDLATRIDALQAAVAALEKQIGRAGREQLKANALSETQAERLAAAMDALRAAGERHEAEIVADRQQAQAAVSEARLAVARSMFPALDGLDEAIRAGRATLDHAARRESAEALLRRLLLGDADADEHREADALHAALDAWLEGLAMVRRRLLDALAAEGVTLIVAEGQPFDPRRHIAVEVVSADVSPGTVVQEIRRGFMVGTRVLRHAEVAVAGESQH
ncbi:nucleotide exchange factor GrpE [Chloroflexales bacterium ZM16-3]|nr:nucleotide exchange factor GrpE [Chloroflexales bacterium ZM16-3]